MAGERGAPRVPGARAGAAAGRRAPGRSGAVRSAAGGGGRARGGPGARRPSPGAAPDWQRVAAAAQRLLAERRGSLGLWGAFAALQARAGQLKARARTLPYPNPMLSLGCHATVRVCETVSTRVCWWADVGGLDAVRCGRQAAMQDLTLMVTWVQPPDKVWPALPRRRRARYDTALTTCLLWSLGLSH